MSPPRDFNVPVAMLTWCRSIQASAFAFRVEAAHYGGLGVGNGDLDREATVSLGDEAVGRFDVWMRSYGHSR